MSDQDEIYATLIEIKQEPTELYKILKFESLVSGGGEAKQVISEGYVFLNGEVETRKRKKIYAGDLIYFNEQYFHIALVGQSGDYDIVETAELEQNLGDSLSTENRSLEKMPFAEETKEQKNMSKKTRKPISF